MKKKILIVGSSANAYSLAKFFTSEKYGFDVYIAPGNGLSSDFATRVDIRENNVAELLKYAIKNNIDLTIVVSKDAIRADIASDFRENSQPIFAPDAECSNFAISRMAAKKFLYKQHIAVPKFGIFDKPQMAIDYLKTAQYPILITTDEDKENAVRAVCISEPQAQVCINDIFSQDESRVLIEEYIYGHSYTLYVVSDGYQTLPICPVGDYRFLEDGDGGIYTQGVGAFAPDYKISFDLVNNMLENEIDNIIKSLQNRGNPYTGILGIEAVLRPDGSHIITGFAPFFKEHDSDIILSLIKSDLYEVMEACANGSFSDDYSEIVTSPMSAVSCVISSRISNSKIFGLDIDDDRVSISHFATKKNKYFEYLANKGRVMTVTARSSTVSGAQKLMYDTIEDIKFDGKKYRTDICLD